MRGCPTLSGGDDESELIILVRVGRCDSKLSSKDTHVEVTDTYRFLSFWAPASQVLEGKRESLAMDAASKT